MKITKCTTYRDGGSYGLWHEVSNKLKHEIRLKVVSVKESEKAYIDKAFQSPVILKHDYNRHVSNVRVGTITWSDLKKMIAGLEFNGMEFRQYKEIVSKYAGDDAE